MLSFGNLQNNLFQLNKYLKKMNGFLQLNVKQLDEKYLQRNNPKMFLMVLHFLIVDYLAELYEVVLDVVPNIASTNDRKFVESVMIVARKVLQIEPIVTVYQVLGEGFLEKKVYFVTEVAKKVVEWETSNCKKAKYPNRNYQSYQNYQSKGHYDSDESEYDYEDKPRSINVTPSEDPLAYLRKMPRNKLPQTVYPLKKNNETRVATMLTKAPKQQSESEYEDSEEFKVTTMHMSVSRQSNHKTAVQPYLPAKVPEAQRQCRNEYFQRVDYQDLITREYFNQCLYLLSTLNSSLNDIVSKFNSFQYSVVGWVNNMNAKVVMLEYNVKIIKANL